VKRYSKGMLLGKGGFAKVYEMVNLESKKIYAGKIIMKSSLSKVRAKQKVNDMQQLRKKNKNRYLIFCRKRVI
jgi:polo-like kinase 1